MKNTLILSALFISLVFLSGSDVLAAKSSSSTAKQSAEAGLQRMLEGLSSGGGLGDIVEVENTVQQVEADNAPDAPASDHLMKNPAVKAAAEAATDKYIAEARAQGVEPDLGEGVKRVRQAVAAEAVNQGLISPNDYDGSDIDPANAETMLGLTPMSVLGGAFAGSTRTEELSPEQKNAIDELKQEFATRAGTITAQRNDLESRGQNPDDHDVANLNSEMNEYTERLQEIVGSEGIAPEDEYLVLAGTHEGVKEGFEAEAERITEDRGSFTGGGQSSEAYREGQSELEGQAAELDKDPVGFLDGLLGRGGKDKSPETSEDRINDLKDQLAERMGEVAGTYGNPENDYQLDSNAPPEAREAGQAALSDYMQAVAAELGVAVEDLPAEHWDPFSIQADDAVFDRARDRAAEARGENSEAYQEGEAELEQTAEEIEKDPSGFLDNLLGRGGKDKSPDEMTPDELRDHYQEDLLSEYGDLLEAYGNGEISVDEFSERTQEMTENHEAGQRNAQGILYEGIMNNGVDGRISEDKMRELNEHMQRQPHDDRGNVDQNVFDTFFPTADDSAETPEKDVDEMTDAELDAAFDEVFGDLGTSAEDQELLETVLEDDDLRDLFFPDGVPSFDGKDEGGDEGSIFDQFEDIGRDVMDRIEDGEGKEEILDALNDRERGDDDLFGGFDDLNRGVRGSTGRTSGAGIGGGAGADVDVRGVTMGGTGMRPTPTPTVTRPRGGGEGRPRGGGEGGRRRGGSSS